jgi:hypothetical protein
MVITAIANAAARATTSTRIPVITGLICRRAATGQVNISTAPARDRS